MEESSALDPTNDGWIQPSVLLVVSSSHQISKTTNHHAATKDFLPQSTIRIHVDSTDQSGPSKQQQQPK